MRNRRAGRYVGATVAAVVFLTCLASFTTIAGGCGRVVENKAESAILKLLPQYVGPADKYVVSVDGKTGAMMRGRLARVHIAGTNVRLTPELTVTALVLDLRDVSVDTQAGRLQNVASSTFSARIAESDLNRYVGDRRPGMRDLHVSCGADGMLTVRARPEIFGYPTVPVEVRGTLSPREDGTRLDFVPDAARVSIIPIPKFVVEHVVNRLNPAVDISTGLALPITVGAATSTQGALTLTGVITSDDLLRAAEQMSK